MFPPCGNTIRDNRLCRCLIKACTTARLQSNTRIKGTDLGAYRVFSKGRDWRVIDTGKECQTLLTRIWICLYPQTFSCEFKSVRIRVYSDSLHGLLRFLAPNVPAKTIRIVTEHALSQMIGPG